MVETKVDKAAHPRETELADYLANAMSASDRQRLEGHIAYCEECLGRMASAYEAVKSFRDAASQKKEKANMLKRINPYLIAAIISFTLSFITPRFFLQFLIATLLLGIKWVSDSKSTKMLIMIYEAWKKGGEKEASRILEILENKSGGRFSS